MIANCLGRATWFKLNSDEFWTLVGMNGAHQYDPETFLYSLFAYGPCGDRYQILTRGADGFDVFTEAETIHEPAAPTRVIDTVGAGDAFTAAMVCLHLEGRTLRQCAHFANHYAARVCEHVGATPRIDRAEVERAAGFSPC
jgi:fructokinase